VTTIQKLQSQPVGERTGTTEVVLHEYYTASVPAIVPRHDRRRLLMHQVYGKVSGTQNMCHIFARTGHGQAVQGRRFQYLIVKIVNDLFFWKSIDFGDKNDMIW